MTGAMVESSPLQLLAERAIAGDRNAFDELVRHCEGRLRTSIERQLDGNRQAHEVDEILQETFALAFEALGRFEWRGDASFSAWLARISRNVLIDRAKDSRRSRYLELPDQVDASDVSPSRRLRRGERFDRLEEAIRQLPPDYREVIRLSQDERLKVREIALQMERSEYAVKHLLARALRKLRETFGDTESLHLPERPLRWEGGGRDEE